MVFGCNIWALPVRCLSDGLVVEPDLSTVFCPDHKAAMVLFLDRVYGIESHSFLLRLLEVGFLPDLQAAVSLDTVSTENVILQGTIVGVACYFVLVHVTPHCS